VVSELTTFVFCKKGRQKAICDLNYVWDRFETMLPQRSQDKTMFDPSVEWEMRELHARLYAMETTQRWTAEAGDISEAERKNEARAEEEVVAGDATEECLFRAITRIGAR
jgi:hypothetical protein